MLQLWHCMYAACTATKRREVLQYVYTWNNSIHKASLHPAVMTILYAACCPVEQHQRYCSIARMQLHMCMYINSGASITVAVLGWELYNSKSAKLSQLEGWTSHDWVCVGRHFCYSTTNAFTSAWSRAQLHAASMQVTNNLHADSIPTRILLQLATTTSQPKLGAA